MKARCPGGFSLVELLVVILIIGLLAMLLFPSMARLYEASKLMECSQRLYYIGQAYQVRASEARVKPELGVLQVERWKSQLRPYLEEKSDQLMCPVASLEPGVPEGWKGVDPWDRARTLAAEGKLSAGGFFPDEDIVERPSLESLKVEVWLRPGPDFRGVKANNLIYVMDCTEGQWAMKKNVTPTSYELWFEDSWNTTWNDLILRFEELPDGSLRITYVDEHTGGNCYNLVNVETGEVLLCGMGDGNAYHGWPKLPKGTSVVLKPENKKQEGPTDDDNPDFAIADDTIAEGGVAGRGTRGSYGMNSFAHRRESIPGRVILCLDYKKTVARGPTDRLPDWWHEEGWQTEEGLPVFARHFGKINVLFTDGSVELMDPWVIDPSGPAGVEKWWDPRYQESR